MRHHHHHDDEHPDEFSGHPGRRHHDDHRSGRGEDPSGPRGGRGRGGRFDPREGFGPGRGRGPREGHGSGDGFGPGEGFGPGSGFGPRGGGPRGHGGRGPGGRGRRPRGEVRTAVLLLLAEEPMHGYQLMQTIGDRTGGRWAPSPGAIYPTLSQLEDEGLVLTAKEGGRKLAELTEEGRAHVEEHRAGWSDPFATGDADAEELPDVRAAMHDLGGAVREAARGADAAQLTAVAGILAEARRSVYRILAGDHIAAPGADAPETADTGTDPTAPDREAGGREAEDREAEDRDAGDREAGDPAGPDTEGSADGTPAP